MCVVSFIGDAYKNNFPTRWPQYDVNQITRVEFEALKKEVEGLRELLLKAKEFDKATGQPDCQMDEKVDFIKQLAKLLGVDMEGIFE